LRRTIGGFQRCGKITDTGAMAVKHAFSISEAYVDYLPTGRVSLGGGRMEEVFADNMRFFWDDDVRFNQRCEFDHRAI
jgi:hypothetical protein